MKNCIHELVIFLVKLVTNFNFILIESSNSINLIL